VFGVAVGMPLSFDDTHTHLLRIEGRKQRHQVFALFHNHLYNSLSVVALSFNPPFAPFSNITHHLDFATGSQALYFGLTLISKTDQQSTQSKNSPESHHLPPQPQTKKTLTHVEYGR
jgi:hypothetical protein